MISLRSKRLFTSMKTNRVFVIGLTIVCMLVSGCSISTPFKRPKLQTEIVTSDENVITALTYIETGNNNTHNKTFWKNVKRVYESLEATEGLIGYSIKREVFGNRGWTMTVWKDEKSLEKFVSSSVHQTAIKHGMPALTKTAFARVSVRASQVPISWNEAESIIQNSDRQYISN